MSAVVLGTRKLGQQQLGLLDVDSLLQFSQMVILDLAWVFHPVEAQLQPPELDLGKARPPLALNLFAARLLCVD